MSRFGVPRLSDLLTADEQALIVQLAKRRKYRDGELIHERGDKESSVGFVVSGKVKMFNPRSDGVEVFSGLIHTGQSFGDAGLLHGESRLHRAVALGEAVIDHVDRDSFEQLLDHVSIVRALYKISTFRLATTLALLDDMRTLSPELRLARLLARMQAAAGGAGRLDFVQEELAGMMGVSTVTLAKALRLLGQRGLVKPGYRHVQVADAKGLTDWIAEQGME